MYYRDKMYYKKLTKRSLFVPTIKINGCLAVFASKASINHLLQFDKLSQLVKSKVIIITEKRVNLKIYILLGYMGTV